MEPSPGKLLSFWFAAALESSDAFKQRMSFWYTRNPETDEEIRGRFEPWLEKGERSELGEWKTEPKSLLALTILFDQVPRNIYRGSARAFHYDPLALRCCLESIKKQFDKTLSSAERLFPYMPLMHSEDIEMQDLCIQAMQGMVEDCDPGVEEMLNGSVGYAEKHRVIIKQYGRFPYRNEVLDRVNTTEEEEYLKTADRFGQ